MALSDIAALAEVAHRHGIEMIVDNTFMSPYFQRPLELGADMVLHSTTKFLNGHSDGLGGAIVCSKREQLEKLAFVQKAAGAIMSPFECWLVLRGIKTLPVRMKQHDENGRLVADFLSAHRKVSKVFYPGLPEHPGHELAKRQMSGFGSMIAFETGSLENASAAAALLASVHPGRVAGRRRDADCAPGNHEPRSDRRKRPQGDGYQRWSAAPFGGAGRRGRHHRRPRSGAGVPVERTCVTSKVSKSTSPSSENRMSGCHPERAPRVEGPLPDCSPLAVGVLRLHAPKTGARSAQHDSRVRNMTAR